MVRSADDLPLRLARAMLWASFGILAYIRAFGALDGGADPLGVLLPMASYPPLIALSLWCWRPAVRYGLFATVVLLYLLPFPFVGESWDWMPWTVAAAALCVLPARIAWPLFVLSVAAAGGSVLLLGYDAAPGQEIQAALGYMIVTADDGLIVFGLSRLVMAVTRLHRTREELARMALSRERLRLDGELRHLVGGKLQAIMFRMRAAARQEPGEARHSLREGIELARRTLAEVRATAGAYRADAPEEVSPPIESPRLARRVLLAVLVIQCLLVMRTLAYVRPGDWPAFAFAAVLLVVIVILQMLPQSRAVLVAQSLLILLPLPVLPDAWDRLLSIFTGKLLLNVRPPRSWAIVGVVLGGHLAWFLHRVDRTFLFIDDVPAALANFGGHIMIMWLVYCLGRLSGLLTVLERSRHELAEAAVRRERLRIAGDLHDILGYSLSAVALKGEVAERLLDSDPARAEAEIAALGSLVERALVELDSITGDRVKLRLGSEIDAAREVLASAGITAAVRVETGALPAAVDTALATVLREGVTNVLRHSQARTCEIIVSGTADGVRLRLVNDGAAVREEAEPPERRGSGLDSIAERTGGRVTAGHRAGGRFEVLAEFAAPAGPGVGPRGFGPVAGSRLSLG
ncbi:sensor histidine kinase [Nonomuraea roseoviolacea]|uniref:Two-component system sensor histidine kinase DesK n=1 Tax=Nonomuraea roseoviolacea subsp. carminata TaxID=160689 RepID=A0ABT1JVV6_9ACTN|nr:histidine kinase [Nonomuraea roseoviolacea]MCP2345881.1 two-component system sensor histidine kinase DesK [Nonomuraea roseoviolacea subsp. carminata]